MGLKTSILQIYRLSAIVSILALFASVLTIVGDLVEAQTVADIFKPVTMALIILLAGMSSNPPSRS